MLASSKKPLLLLEVSLSFAHDRIFGQLLVRSADGRGATRSHLLGKSSGFLVLSGLGEGGFVVRSCPAGTRAE